MKWLSLIVSLFCSLNLIAHEFQELFVKANRAFSSKDFSKAIEYYEEILTTHKTTPEIYFNLGITYIETKEYKKALNCLKEAIKLKPDYGRAYYHIGRALENLNLKKEAITAYTKAHELEPDFFELLPILANLLRDDNQFDQALIYYQKAASLQPKNIHVLLDLANTLNTTGKTEEALEWYFTMLEMLPQNPAILYNIAYTYKKLNRLADAMPYYDRALKLQPDHIEAHFSYGLALLLTGNHNPDNWELGWKEYEWRWKRNQSQSIRTYSQPLWNGEPLDGKIFFLWAEQGLGDTFEFIRYAKVVKDLGASKVIVAVQKPLIDFAKNIPYIDQIIAIDAKPPYFNYHAPMVSMPYLTKTRLHNVPADIPYLYADQDLMQEWKDILSEDTNFKIGICWQGNPNYSTQFLRMTVAAKSMSVEKFLPIMNIPGVTVYSLQKTTGTDQLNALPEDAPLVIFGEDFDTTRGRFNDTAAVIKNLDLVITIDTSICHLAAGLGVPTWNLLPNPPDWRWMLDCDNTPWFANMRLFRQPTPGDWDSVIEKVIQELKAHLYYNKPLIVHEHPYSS